MAIRVDGLRRPFGDRVRDYVALTKPRIIVLLEVTTLFAMIMAARGWPSWGLMAATLAGGWLAAAGANTINCWFDRDIDGTMSRTRSRPLPSGRVEPLRALLFGAGLTAGAFAVLAGFVNVLAAGLALAAGLFYILVYTMWLKRSSTQNIVIGGAAGAIPPMVGWAAVEGRLGLTALFLFAIIFYWTPPHFWALALVIEKDYARASVPMLPVVAGDRRTRRQILLFTVILTMVTIMPFLAHSFGIVYLAGAVALDAVLLWDAVVVLGDTGSRSARRLFYHSLLYLALLFAIMAVDRIMIAG
ncbi:MAG: heme o synthase [Candidatus Dormibacteria bacterium]